MCVYVDYRMNLLRVNTGPIGDRCRDANAGLVDRYVDDVVISCQGLEISMTAFSCNGVMNLLGTDIIDIVISIHNRNHGIVRSAQLGSGIYHSLLDYRNGGIGGTCGTGYDCGFSAVTKGRCILDAYRTLDQSVVINRIGNGGQSCSIGKRHGGIGLKLEFGGTHSTAGKALTGLKVYGNLAQRMYENHLPGVIIIPFCKLVSRKVV